MVNLIFFPSRFRLFIVSEKGGAFLFFEFPNDFFNCDKSKGRDILSTSAKKMIVIQGLPVFEDESRC